MNALAFLKKDWPALVLMLLPVGLALLFWNRLPAEMVSHWGISGEADDTVSKTAFLWMIMGTSLFVYLLLAVVPYIDPKPNARQVARPLKPIRLATMALLCAVFSAIILYNLGMSVDVLLVVKIGVPLLFLVIGNLFGKIRPNYFVGMRTPWTLENEAIWKRVHRFSGKLWVIGSLILLVLGFVLADMAYFIMMMAITLILALVPAIYSYQLYRRQQNHSVG